MATDDERAVHFEEMRGIMKNSENKSFMQWEEWYPVEI